MSISESGEYPRCLLAPLCYRSYREWMMVLYSGSSPWRVGDFCLISDRIQHAGENFQAHVLLVA